MRDLPALIIFPRATGPLPSLLLCGAGSLRTNGTIMRRTTLLMEKVNSFLLITNSS